MKLIIEIPDSEISEAADFMASLPAKAKSIQLTVGQFTQVELKFTSLRLEHKPTVRKLKVVK